MRKMIRQAGNLICLAAAFAGFLAAQARRDSGQALFAARCAVCHGALGDGGSAPDLTNSKWQASKTDEQLELAIHDGLRGAAMPAFGGSLDAESLQALVRHIRSLSTNPSEGAAIRALEIVVRAERAACRVERRRQLADVRPRLLEPSVQPARKSLPVIHGCDPVAHRFRHLGDVQQAAEGDSDRY